jgi:hypothetical protein
MNIYPDALTPSQSEVLRQLGPYMTNWNYYLAGGAALAIYLRHRRSVDLDWFTGDKISDPMQLAQSLRDVGLPFTTGSTAPGTLHGSLLGVRLTFLEFRYPLLAPLTPWPESGALLASLDDLACMKLSAIAQRGSRKDFIDLYALCTQHRPLAEMLELYRLKFSVEDITPVLYGLAYFDDAQSEPIPAMLWEVDWRTVKKSITGWVKELIKE